MNLRDLFQTLDRLEVPDLRRTARDRSTKYGDRVDSASLERPGRSKRFLAVVAAALVSMISLALLVMAFQNPEPSPSKSSAPLFANMRCDEGGMHADTTQVQAQPDGVHLRVRNELSANPGISMIFEGGGFGENLKPLGLTELIVSIPPGHARIACGEASTNSARIEVIDPQGFYVSPILQCPGPTGDLGAAPAHGQDPIEVARDALLPILEADDEFERAGYPEAVPRTLRATRDGNVVAVVTLVPKDGVGWTSDEASVCVSLLP